jgi:RNA polymerase sigma-70 factor, ECF subfamily
MHPVTAREHAAARAAWPAIEVPLEIFVDYVAARSSSRELPRLADLYLACACARGDEVALATFRRRFGPLIRHAARDLADEVEQRVLTKLFVGRADIARYNGSGQLSTWVLVVARREASNARRSEPRRDREREAMALIQHALDDEAVAGMKRRYRSEFKLAFEHAIAQLTARERNLLRYECIEQLGIDDIARIHGVSSSTVARWRARCREQVLRTTGDWLRRHGTLEGDEIGGLLGLIESQLELSLARVLPS